MAEAKKSPGTAPIMDVTRPGKSVPSPNAKHVIVNHRPLVGDPMVTPKKIDVADMAPDAEPPSTRTNAEAPTLQPLLAPLPIPEADAEPETETDAEAVAEPSPKPPTKSKQAKKPKAPEPAEPEPEVEAETKAKPEVETEPKAKAKAEVQPNEPEKAEPEPEPEKTDDKADTAAAEKADSKLEPDKTDEQTVVKSDPAAEAEAEAVKETERAAAIQKLVDDKQYYLPINSVEKRRSRRFVALGVLLSMLLAVAWVDVALDAGLIHIGNIKPVTHFFSN